MPSLTDFLMVAVFVWLFLAGPAGWRVLLADGDTGWHIRTGEWILAHGHVPTQDLFSFSKAGAPWFAWEWLSDVLFAWLFHAAGFKALLLFTGIVIAAFSGVILRFAIWRGANPMVAGLAVLLTVGASTMHFLARPHVFTLLFLPLSIWLIEADRRRASSRVWLLVPLTVLWTNLHGGWAILIACLVLLVAGSAAEAWLGVRAWSSVWRYSAVTAACSAATLLNPYGIELHRHILAYLQSDWIRNHIQEFEAPTFRTEGETQFEVLLLAGVFLSGWLLQKRNVTGCLWILFLGHSALTSLRHAPLYAGLAGPLIASEVSLLWAGWIKGRQKTFLPRIFYELGRDLVPSFSRITIWPVAALVVLSLLPQISWPTDFPSELFPIKLIQEQQSVLASGRLLTTDQWGDYLIFHYTPRLKVFIDGRSDFYGSEFGNDYFRLLQGAWDWDEILAKHRFDVALVPAAWPLSNLLKQEPRWQLVRDDGQALLFVRKAARTTATVQSGLVSRTKENPTER
ncbi:MAG TPA: hypothetical protein VKG25_03230 [Bryobacteraceae bacterium]|nr:hypothetical protein [Bryobacteraceae bacterium]